MEARVGDTQGHSLALPNLGVSLLSALSATRDGFVLGNSNGIVGVVSGAAPEPRTFLTGLSGIKAITVSYDGKLTAVGDSTDMGAAVSACMWPAVEATLEKRDYRLIGIQGLLHHMTTEQHGTIYLLDPFPAQK